MDQSTIVPFPGAAAGSADDVALAEIEAGVALVALGLATRVRLVAIPHLEDVAPEGLALAQASRVAFALDRSTSGSVALTLGPRTHT